MIKAIKKLYNKLMPKKIILKDVFNDWKITQLFGKTPFAIKHPEIYKYKQHTGIDFGMRKGTKIYAPHDGIMVKVDSKIEYTKEGLPTGTGLSFSLWDSKQLIATRYYHTQKLIVKLNKIYKEGDLIGYVGDTGHNRSGSHLHFELVETNDIAHVINKDNGAGGAIDPYSKKVKWVK